MLPSGSPGGVFPLTLWTLTGLQILRAEGRPQVIGSSQPIMSTLGDDAILPCHVETGLNVENLTVEWWKPDIQLDPLDPMSNNKYVHRYHDNRDEEDMQMPSYASRTSLFTDGLKHGNISLKIKNVKFADGGRYRCQIPDLARAAISSLLVVRGKRPCTACDQGFGLFAKQGCTATTDTVCDVVSGYFCKALMDDTGCSLAQKHAVCGPGHRTKEPGTSRTDTVCESCPPGYFSQDGVDCTVWTTCSEAQGKVREGSTSSDVVCGAASREHYFYVAVLLPIFTVVGLVVKGMLSVENLEVLTHSAKELHQVLQDPARIRLERRPYPSGLPR